MKQRHFFLAAAMAAIFVGCAKNSADIGNLQSQIDALKSDQIQTINGQISAIQKSIANLQGMDKELDGYINSLKVQAALLEKTDKDLEKSIADLKTELSGQITATEELCIAQLEAYTKAINEELASINSSIAALQTEGIDLQQQITVLQTYIDKGIGDTKDWVSATFATLEQYNKTAELVATIKAQMESLNLELESYKKKAESDLNSAISDLSEELQIKIKKVADDASADLQSAIAEINSTYTTAISGAISDSETSMKAWLNEQLTGYYNIAQMNAKLEVMEKGYADGDEILKNEIDKLTANLEAAKADIKTAYEKAIKDAIETSEGKINAKIAADINTANDALQTQIDAVNAKVTEIEKRLGLLTTRVDALEEGVIIEAIQSIVYVPRYADSKSAMWFSQTGMTTVRGDRDTLDFLIKPSGKAAEIVASSKINITANLAYNALTRSSSGLVDLPVIAKASEGDILSVIVDGSSVSSDFFFGKQGASIRVSVTSKVNDKSSESVQTAPAQKATVFFNSDEIELYENKTKQIIFTTYPASSKLMWTSSNASVATISSSGLVSGVAKGNATISASTADGYVATCKVKVDESPCVNLSANGTANCYIVSSAGSYMFNASVKGNSNESVGTPVKAEVLWESFGTSTAPNVGDIIASVTYADGDVILTTPETIANGNAVIAVKDASNTILWSWHIWVCKDFDPVATQQIYVNNAGIMMDRNLGAISPEQGDVGSLGLLYQWGRKDPFVGSSNISTSVEALCSVSRESTSVSGCLSNNNSLEYSIKHPNTFIMSSSDWYCSSSSYRDDELWGASGDKSKYDPCPSGWRVPKGGSNGVFVTAGFPNGSYNTFTYDSTNQGMLFGSAYSSPSAWYPVTGGIKGSSGTLVEGGKFGYYLTATVYNETYCCEFAIHYNGSVYNNYSSYYYRAHGRSVRCCKE